MVVKQCVTIIHSSTQNAYYRYPGSTACSFLKLCTIVAKMGGLGEIMFVTNIVYVAMITFDNLVDIFIPNMRQNGLVDAYFVVVISRWIKRNFAIFFCA